MYGLMINQFIQMIYFNLYLKIISIFIIEMYEYTPYKMKEIIQDKIVTIKNIHSIDKLLCSNPYSYDYLIDNKCIFYWEEIYLYSKSKYLPIPKEKYLFEYISMNPHLTEIIKDNLDKLDDYFHLSMNKSAVSLLENNLHNINWNMLSANKNAISLLEKYQHNINWNYLSANKNALQLLEKNMNKINWKNLSVNKNAIHLLEKNKDKIDWIFLSENKNAIHLLEQNFNKINWTFLASNKNAIHLLEKNIDKLSVHGWTELCGNKNAFELIMKYPEKIQWASLLKNPSIFEIDYKKIKERLKIKYDELIHYCLHPNRVLYYNEKYKYNIIIEEYHD